MICIFFLHDIFWAKPYWSFVFWSVQCNKHKFYQTRRILWVTEVKPFPVVSGKVTTLRKCITVKSSLVTASCLSALMPPYLLPPSYAPLSIYCDLLIPCKLSSSSSSLHFYTYSLFLSPPSCCNPFHLHPLMERFKFLDLPSLLMISITIPGTNGSPIDKTPGDGFFNFIIFLFYLLCYLLHWC